MRYVPICCGTSWHTFVVRSETWCYCVVFCVLPFSKLEYGFIFHCHKLSLAICIICKYLDSRLHVILVPSLDSFHFFYQPCSLIYASSSFMAYIYMILCIYQQQTSSKSIYCHIYHLIRSICMFHSKAPNSTEAARRYRRLVQPASTSTAPHKDVRKGNLSEIQVPLSEKDVVLIFQFLPFKIWWGARNPPNMIQFKNYEITIRSREAIYRIRRWGMSW